MSGRDPQEIWHETVDEGERRIDRSAAALLATGFVGGLDVMLGILALVVLSGGLAEVMPHETAHALASVVFGIGLVFIVIGRSELFTENFLVPVNAVMRGRRPAWSLLRLWGLTLLGNVAALLALAVIISRAGLVPPTALDAAGEIADTFASRDMLAALLSAILAGAVMTLMTWLVHASEDETAKVLLALLVGFVLSAPSLNHAVVGIGEMALGIIAERGSAEWLDLFQNLPWAIAGNLLGGLGFVTAMRLVQARGEPD